MLVIICLCLNDIIIGLPVDDSAIDVDDDDPLIIHIDQDLEHLA